MIGIMMWLFMFLVIPVSIVFFRRNLKVSPKSIVSLALINFILIYVFVVGSSQLVGVVYRYQLERLDTDGDGVFPLAEDMTEEERLAFDRVISDTGRNMAFFTGVPIAAFHTFIFSLLLLATARYRSRASELERTTWHL